MTIRVSAADAPAAKPLEPAVTVHVNGDPEQVTGPATRGAVAVADTKVDPGGNSSAIGNGVLAGTGPLPALVTVSTYVICVPTTAYAGPVLVSVSTGPEAAVTVVEDVAHSAKMTGSHPAPGGVGGARPSGDVDA